MDDRLATTTARALERMTRARSDELRARYELGRIVHFARYDETRGSEAVRELATVTSLDISAVRRLARVTEIVGPKEFETWLAASLAHGYAFTWSHLEVLANIRVRAARAKLATEAIAARMSVRELRARLRLFGSR
ncbi:MAG TPA: hypothetical protein VGL81_36175 [Polyangiaceae bacterium]|jgi:hypothetical protein